MRFIIVGLTSGIIFWILEGIINANPYAQKLYVAFKPILKPTISIPKAFLIYLFYGFVFSGMFLFFYNTLPGSIGIVKGLGFALLVWYFRGLMAVLNEWLTFAVPPKALVYAATAGLIESLLLGMFYGLLLKP
jgi:hypothetical protein